MDMNEGVAGFHHVAFLYVNLQHASGQTSGDFHGGGFGLTLYGVLGCAQAKESDYGENDHAYCEQDKG